MDSFSPNLASLLSTASQPASQPNSCWTLNPNVPFTEAFLNYFLLEKKTPEKKNSNQISLFRYRCFKTNFIFTKKKPSRIFLKIKKKN
jgi:hypothetical protein